MPLKRRRRRLRKSSTAGADRMGELLDQAQRELELVPPLGKGFALERIVKLQAAMLRDLRNRVVQLERVKMPR